MKTLKISSNLSLPLDAVTNTFAVLAKRGAGKSYLASVLAEEMLKAGQQVVAIDPTGGWWGLRSSASGKEPGFPVVVLGGENGDLPLEESAGEVIAASIVESRFPCVLDLSLFRKGQMIRFMVAFAEKLYHLNREPVHLFVDEADSFAPQGRSGFGVEENRLLGAMEDIVRRGRKRGIGCTLITQRPAVLNKSVLTQCESLFCLRLVHPRDIDAIEEWVNVHAEPDEAKKVIDSLPVLAIGETWFWSPGWMGALKRVKIRQRETFDSSATPKPGETVRKPKTRAEIDLSALGEKIQATVEKVKENDPRELKRQIADLQRQLRERPTEKVPEPVRVEVPVLNNGQLDRLTSEVNRLAEQGTAIVDLTATLRQEMARAATKPVPGQAPRSTRPLEPARPASTRPLQSKQASTMTSTSEMPTADTGQTSGPEQRILDALAWLESIGVTEPEQAAAAFLAGYTVGGGAWNNPRGRLHTRGLIEYRGGGRLALTDAGRALANPPAAPLTTDELHRHVMDRLPSPEKKILQVLLDVYPDQISNEELARRAGYEPKGGAFANPKGRLRTLGLAIYPQKGFVAAAPLLFLESQ